MLESHNMYLDSGMHSRFRGFSKSSLYAELRGSSWSFRLTFPLHPTAAVA